MMHGRVRALGLDAGGTMTDTIFVNDEGGFVIGKSQTTPADESLGFANSVEDALSYWDLPKEEVFPAIVSGVYSGTSMLNRLLERKGQRVGLIVSRGMEDTLRLEQGIQTWLGYSYADTLHVVTHRHHEPLVPRSLVRGVGGRVDADGAQVAPLYEDDVRRAVEELLEERVDCICVNLVFSWRNPSHERRVAELAEDVMGQVGSAVPIYLASTVCPKRGDFPRLNTLVVEAYAAEPSREQLAAVRRRTKELGARFDLRVMASFGGTIAMDSEQLATTLVSGPIGGCLGGRFLSEQLGIGNLVCTDVGGTSFDWALVIAHFKLNLPMVRIDTAGAGSGMYVRLNPLSKRLEFGPDSAGSRIGVSNPEGGVETVTVTDCGVVVGWLNPDYFLGGELILSRETAVEKVHEQLAAPLGLSVEAAAAGALELFQADLKHHLETAVMGQGFEPADFTLLSYGGGGPLHVGGFSEGLRFQDVLVPSWAAAFSAFGCVCADYSYRFDRQVDLPLPLDAPADERAAFVERLQATWEQLSARIVEEFARSGIPTDAITFTPRVRMQYTGQINDIEVEISHGALAGPDGLTALVEEFDRLYGRIYASAAKSPELGYFVTLIVMTGTVPVEKPVLPEETVEPGASAEPAQKGVRPVYTRRDGWCDTPLYEMDQLTPGVRVLGPAVIEAPSTTFAVPRSSVAELDGHRIFHLRPE
jgi:N-methylhydantoinase A/acetone carboxylase beta subunit